MVKQYNKKAMKVNVEDLSTVLFALHLEFARGTTLDLSGRRSNELYDAVLPLSLPEVSDPLRAVSWQALVTLCEAYAQEAEAKYLADLPVGTQPTTIQADENAVWQ